MANQAGIAPQRREVRLALRVVGPVIAFAGLVLIVNGVMNFCSSLGSFGGVNAPFPPGTPVEFWGVFVGIPLFFVGVGLTSYAFLEAVTSYVAGEVAPGAKAVGPPLSTGAPTAAPRAVVLCPKCNRENRFGSRFCGGCGAPML